MNATFILQCSCIKFSAVVEASAELGEAQYMIKQKACAIELG